jgi:hypothetical protein
MTLWSTPGSGRLAALAALLVLAACASAPAPVQEVADAERALQAASAADAGNLAPAAFDKARQKLAAARSALQGGEHVRARRLAEQALVDAEVAQAAAEAEEAARAEAGMRAQIRDLGGLPPQAVADL